jgi:hypothetical protein
MTAVPLPAMTAQEFVMPGLVPGIHVFTPLQLEDVDGRDEPGHDAENVRATLAFEQFA